MNAATSYFLLSFTSSNGPQTKPLGRFLCLMSQTTLFDARLSLSRAAGLPNFVYGLKSPKNHSNLTPKQDFSAK
jgi:hypothetical protein